MCGLALSGDSLYRSFGSVKVLKGLSFEVPRGAFLGLFGRNGAGKTTTLDIVTGLLARAVVPAAAHIITIGPSTSAAARDAGLTVHGEAAGRGLEAMIEAMP